MSRNVHVQYQLSDYATPRALARSHYTGATQQLRLTSYTPQKVVVPTVKSLVYSRVRCARVGE